MNYEQFVKKAKTEIGIAYGRTSGGLRSDNRIVMRSETGGSSGGGWWDGAEAVSYRVSNPTRDTDHLDDFLLSLDVDISFMDYKRITRLVKDEGEVSEGHDYYGNGSEYRIESIGLDEIWEIVKKYFKEDK